MVTQRLTKYDTVLFTSNDAVIYRDMEGELFVGTLAPDNWDGYLAESRIDETAFRAFCADYTTANVRHQPSMNVGK